MKRLIEAVKPLRLDEHAYEIPTALRTTTPANAEQKLSLLQSRLAFVSDNLSPNEEVRKLAEQVGVLNIIEQQLGDNSAATLKARAMEVAETERARDSLATELAQIQVQIKQYQEAKHSAQ